MRIQIASQDRVGITQEILSIFAQQGWDLLAMEVSKGFTYVHLKDNRVRLEQISAQLLSVDGVKSIAQVELLPGERKSQQLHVLLAKIPEPIIDIDSKGQILMANVAAGQALAVEVSKLIGKPINEYINLPISDYFKEQVTPQEVRFAQQQYFADITVVKAEDELSGAVLVLRSLTSVGRHLSHLQKGHFNQFAGIIANSANMQDVISQANRFAQLDLPVLIAGETGTGKELFAKAIHDNGPRANKPFLAVNCAALPEHLLESELFGYASGAFTGARNSGKPGLFELADGGTVFLDEIAEIPSYLQAKLLRFLQDFQLRRLGSVTEKKVDVRIISATHQDLLQRIEKQDFRDDLYYRLNVLSLSIPPLRERRQDIPLLVEYFLKDARKQVNQPDISLSDLALNKVCQYDWPGNVRQLQNSLFKVAALATSPTISEREVILDPEVKPQHKVDEQVIDWQQAQQQFERNLLNKLYPLYPSTRKLAERLKVSHNKIAMKLREYQIKR